MTADVFSPFWVFKGGKFCADRSGCPVAKILAYKKRYVDFCQSGLHPRLDAKIFPFKLDKKQSFPLLYLPLLYY